MSFLSSSPRARKALEAIPTSPGSTLQDLQRYFLCGGSIFSSRWCPLKYPFSLNTYSYVLSRLKFCGRLRWLHYILDLLNIYSSLIMHFI
jgi:hypothetical protein